jgi:hypothetical protein
MRVFKNRVLRRIFGLRSDEVTGARRELHNDITRSFITSTPRHLYSIRPRKIRTGHGVRREEKGGEFIRYW